MPARGHKKSAMKGALAKRAGLLSRPPGLLSPSGATGAVPLTQILPSALRVLRASPEALGPSAADTKCRPPLGRSRDLVVEPALRVHILSLRHARRHGGEGGIRTRGGVTPTQHFQCCTIGLSVTSP